LAGVIIVHVTGVGQFVAAGAGAKVAGPGEDGGAGLLQAVGSGSGFPSAEGGPNQFGGGGMGPVHGGKLKVPATGLLEAAEKFVDVHAFGPWSELHSWSFCSRSSLEGR